ncbi:MAG: poly-gamma-glutamate biosynthesis protein PgsC/CapC [Xenococcaceae cyanobacterium MO_167.B52]|nr:poly-gamma-glutamate biosynthesis protein PgsC/CapC [Xenococcaceae cyanobacterium MO_167.B52]
MLTSLNTPEIYRLAMIIGAFVAICYRERYGIIPGGVMIPGLLIILFLVSPLWCLTILVLFFPVYSIYRRFLEQTGYKRRTPMYILAALSLAIANSVQFFYIYIGWLLPSVTNLYGTLIPGIITFNAIKQTRHKIFKGVIITTVITGLILCLIYLIFSVFLQLDFNHLRPQYYGLETLYLKLPLLQFYMAILVGYLIYRFRDIRSGGYLVSPVVGSMLSQPLSGVMFLLGCFVVYFATKLICNLTLIVGIKRYVLVLFLTTAFIWGVELLVYQLDPTLLPFQGSYFFVILAMLSYVNDAILYAHKNILPYLILTVVISEIIKIAINLGSAIFI